MKTRIILYFLFSILALNASAKDFFSTAEPQSVFDITAHFGVNTSNRTIGKKVFDNWNNNSWGTGIDLGATVDINFREWISIQPGFFFESRSGNYAYSSLIVTPQDEISSVTQFGHGRSYNFTIPILASVHFFVADDIRWNVELGPYLQFGLHNSFSEKAFYNAGNMPVGPDTNPGQWEAAKTKAFDFGFKFGTGLTILQHYDLGVHYLAGALDVWKPSKLGGRNKAWVFSVGYKF